MSAGREPLDVVHAWLDAVNSRDYDGVMRVSDAYIEIVGPRGSGYGHPVLREWLDHARVTLESSRTFVRGGAVVIAQHGTWRSTENNEIIGEADVASSFLVEQRRIVRYARYDSLDEALQKAGLDYSDEIGEGVGGRANSCSHPPGPHPPVPSPLGRRGEADQ
jgi:hypothetical protein